MRVVGLHHAQLSIPVGAEDAARAFYCGVLGFEEVEKPEALAGRGGLWLAAGVELLRSVPLPGFERFELRDPFGNRVELIEQHAAER